MTLYEGKRGAALQSIFFRCRDTYLQIARDPACTFMNATKVGVALRMSFGWCHSGVDEFLSELAEPPDLRVKIARVCLDAKA